MAAFTGRPTVVDLWASWCQPCRREMPVLGRAQAASPDVDFVFINQGEAPARVLRYRQDENLRLRNVLLDASGTAGRAFDQQGLPTTLFFDARGRLVSARIGALSELCMVRPGGMVRPDDGGKQIDQAGFAGGKPDRMDPRPRVRARHSIGAARQSRSSRNRCPFATMCRCWRRA